MSTAITVTSYFPYAMHKYDFIAKQYVYVPEPEIPFIAADPTPYKVKVKPTDQVFENPSEFPACRDINGILIESKK